MSTIVGMEMVLLNTRSALECWERQLAQHARAIDASTHIECIGAIRNADLHMKGLFEISKPITIAVTEKSKRSRPRRYRCQIWSRPFPPDSICLLPQPGVGLASPAFCYLQMAAKLSLPDAIRLGMELCGQHSTLPFAPDMQPAFRLSDKEVANGYVARPALMRADELRGWLSHAGYPYSRAATASRYILDNARSPGESRLYMLLCLPAKMGGYGLPRPLLNARIDLPASSWALAGTDHYLCDLYYPANHVAIEYDGGYHEDSRQRDSDSIRETLIKETGITVVRIDKRQLSSASLFDMRAREIARLLRVRTNPPSDSMKRARAKLRRETLDWNANPYVLPTPLTRPN